MSDADPVLLPSLPTQSPLMEKMKEMNAQAESLTAFLRNQRGAQIVAEQKVLDLMRQLEVERAVVARLRKDLAEARSACARADSVRVELAEARTREAQAVSLAFRAKELTQGAVDRVKTLEKENKEALEAARAAEENAATARRSAARSAARIERLEFEASQLRARLERPTPTSSSKPNPKRKFGTASSSSLFASDNSN